MFKSVTPLNRLFFILDQAVIYSFCENCRTLLILLTTGVPLAAKKMANGKVAPLHSSSPVASSVSREVAA